MQIRVDCYAGYRSEETPRYIKMANNKIEVIQILDRWLAPDHRYFKILGEDKTVEILKNAILLEKRGKAFYQKVAEQASGKAVKAFFETMADEEVKYVKILKNQGVTMHSRKVVGHAESEFRAKPGRIWSSRLKKITSG